MSEPATSKLPRVSLVTPSFNAGPYLRAAIESVLTQDYPHIEYLVMDGGSTDGTIALLREYGDRIRWVSARDDGQADAIASGFEKTGGTILGWLNADDILGPGAVRTAVEAFQAHPGAVLVYGDADFIDAEDRVIGPCTVVEPFSRQRLLDYGDYIIQPAAFFSRQAYNTAGGLDRSLYWAMDWDLWLRLVRCGEAVYIEQPLASYRWLGSNKTAEGGFERLQEIEMVARRYGGKGLPAYFRLEKARLLSFRAKQALRQRRPGRLLRDVVGAAVTIFGSWHATRCLFRPHIWRNYRTAQKLYRQVGAERVETQ